MSTTTFKAPTKEMTELDLRWSSVVEKLQQDPDYDLQDVFPNAGAEVDGRSVRDDVPNYSSISSALTDYTVLQYVRAVPLSVFAGLDPKESYMSRDDIQRVHDLANTIAESGEIAPLIVVIDGSSEGPYILEGGHRSSALYMLGAKMLPAVVVVDENDFR